MKLTLVIPLHRARNVAVAPARDPRNPERIATSRELEERVRERQADWLRLFEDPDVWSDPSKRQAMLRARWDYHDAVAAWHIASDSRPGDPAGRDR
jgi:hypothetical protein